MLLRNLTRGTADSLLGRTVSNAAARFAIVRTESCETCILIQLTNICSTLLVIEDENFKRRLRFLLAL